MRAQCLEYALASNQEYGVWGGTTPRQRFRMQRRRAAGYEAGSAWGEGVTIVDPNTTLAEIRTLALMLYEHWDGIRSLPIDELEGKSFALAGLINAMDEWLCDGNLLPADWQRPRES